MHFSWHLKYLQYLLCTMHWSSFKQYIHTPVIPWILGKLAQRVETLKSCPRGANSFHILVLLFRCTWHLPLYTLGHLSVLYHRQLLFPLVLKYDTWSVPLKWKCEYWGLRTSRRSLLEDRTDHVTFVRKHI